MALERLKLVMRGQIVPPQAQAPARSTSNAGNSNNDNNLARPADITGMASLSDNTTFFKFMEVHTRNNPGVAQGQRVGPLEVLKK